MSFNAVWPIYDKTNLDAGEQMTVATEDDVDILVEKLSREDAGAAMLEHQARSPASNAGFFGAADTAMPDHVFTAGVWRGYGYATYVDPDHEQSTLTGNPQSPMYSSEYSEFPAGSGVSVEQLTMVLKEFLATGRRPTCVEWQDV